MIIGKYLVNSIHRSTGLTMREANWIFSLNKSANTNLIVQLGNETCRLFQTATISCSPSFKWVSSIFLIVLPLWFCNFPVCTMNLCHFELNRFNEIYVMQLQSKLIHFNPTLLNISLNKIHSKLLIKIISSAADFLTNPTQTTPLYETAFVRVIQMLNWNGTNE